MSRTYKEHHPTAHNPKNRFPSPYLDKEGKVERSIELTVLKAGKDGAERPTLKSTERYGLM